LKWQRILTYINFHFSCWKLFLTSNFFHSARAPGRGPMIFLCPKPYYFSILSPLENQDYTILDPTYSTYCVWKSVNDLDMVYRQVCQGCPCVMSWCGECVGSLSSRVKHILTLPYTCISSWNFTCICVVFMVSILKQNVLI